MTRPLSQSLCLTDTIVEAESIASYTKTASMGFSYSSEVVTLNVIIITQDGVSYHHLE